MKQTKIALLFLAFVSICAFAPQAAAGDGELESKYKFSFWAETDLRYIIDKNRGAEKDDGYRWDWNRNQVNFDVEAFPSSRSRGKVSAKFVFFGFGNYKTLPEVNDHAKLDPYWLELNEAFVEVHKFLLDSLDIKVGRQTVTWGAADMFNPTDLVNSRDLWDPLDYTAKVPNNMVKFDWYPADALTLSLIFVPFFKPARHPDSSILGLISTSAAPPIKDKDVIKKLSAFQSAGSDIKVTAHVIDPEKELKNAQFAARAKLHFGSYDVGLSYYYGRWGFPQPVATKAYDEKTIDAWVYYPRIQMLGLDTNASLDWFFDLGLFAEAALFFPEKVTFAMSLPDGMDLGLPDPIKSENMSGKAYTKYTVGMDYNFGRHFYANLQYVYGFFDEINDIVGIKHYLVPNLDIKLAEDTILIRLSSVFCASDLSAIVTPSITYQAADGVQLSMGALYFIGDTEPKDALKYRSEQKFGAKAVGRSEFYLKAKLSM